MKLDLHTHVYEALGFRRLDVELAGRIVAKIKEKGLDGIGVTEHNDRTFGFQLKEMVDKHFPDQVLIIPGQEVNAWPVQVVELYLPEKLTFRFLAHPGYPGDFTNYTNGLHGIEIENPLHDWHINKEKVSQVAEKHNLMLMRNSDAHSLEDLGERYNQISLEELCSRAKGGGL